ncbi:MAG: hypothetical protein MSO56_12520, partial [Clostridiales bacterium]|nr:hypothetical protein [Clostridiales bacterium]
PASRYNNPPPKSLIFQAFWAKQRFEYFKTLGGRSGQKSPDRTFLTSWRETAHLVRSPSFFRCIRLSGGTA